jgi:hypothetical protein
LRPVKDGPEHLDIYIRKRLRPEFEELARQSAPKIAIAPVISHPLVLRSEKLLNRGKLNQRGLVISKNGALPHILVSREQLPRALTVLNALLLALEERNKPASWPKQDNSQLAVSIDGEAVRFSLSELTNSAPHVLTPSEVKRPWSAPKHDYKLTGRLQLQITNVPLLMGPIRRTWADGKQQRIEDCIGDFMVGLTVAAAAIRKNRQETEERHRQWEEERKREEEERRIAEEQKRRAELVTELIENWEEAEGFGDLSKPSRKKLCARVSRKYRRTTFSRLPTGPGSTPTRWIRCPIFQRPSRSSFVRRASTGGRSEFALTA